MSHSFDSLRTERRKKGRRKDPLTPPYQRYPALRLWTQMKLVITVPLFVALLCVTAGMRKSVVKSIRSSNLDAASLKFYPELGLYRLVSFAFLVIFWNTQSSLQARGKWPSFHRVKLSTSGQDQSKKFIKSGFQTQRYNHKNCDNWRMQAGSLYVSLVKAESYASEARLRGKNLSDSNDKSTYRSGQYTMVYLSTLLILRN